MLKIYLASSWRNSFQPAFIKLFQDLGHKVYDFRNPINGDPGFHWKDIDPNWKSWTADQYKKNLLENELCLRGFNNDFDAMKWADCGFLLMPCGRSAHLEAGYFVGAKKPLYIYITEGEPELMYRMASQIFTNIKSVKKAFKQYH